MDDDHYYVQNKLNDELKYNSINLSTSYWNNIFESIKLINRYWSKIFKIDWRLYVFCIRTGGRTFSGWCKHSSSTSIWEDVVKRLSYRYARGCNAKWKWCLLQQTWCIYHRWLALNDSMVEFICCAKVRWTSGERDDAIVFRHLIPCREVLPC